MSDFSSFLFSRPSFLEGAGRVVDFGDTLTEFNRSRNTREADDRALRADWQAVGGDLREAFANYQASRLGTKQISKKA